jgi:hypothetical protein
MSQVYDDFRATLWLGIFPPFFHLRIFPGMFLCVISFIALLTYISVDKMSSRYYDRPYNRNTNLGNAISRYH